MRTRLPVTAFVNALWLAVGLSATPTRLASAACDLAWLAAAQDASGLWGAEMEHLIEMLRRQL